MGIVEEQGGFRPERGTEDQIFILIEVLRTRTDRTTFTAFIDVKKAYDTVWRTGLWKRLWDEGVRGMESDKRYVSCGAKLSARG